MVPIDIDFEIGNQIDTRLTQMANLLGDIIDTMDDQDKTTNFHKLNDILKRSLELTDILDQHVFSRIVSSDDKVYHFCLHYITKNTPFFEGLFILSHLHLSDSQMVIQRTPIKPNFLIYLKNFYPNIFPKNCKMLDLGTI